LKDLNRKLQSINHTFSAMISRAALAATKFSKLTRMKGAVGVGGGDEDVAAHPHPPSTPATRAAASASLAAAGNFFALT
jgi:hypothetical protein